MTALSWLGIVLCLSQSALLSGLNLAYFSLGRLELEVAAQKGDLRAARVRALRQDGNFLLVTILWGNVAVNVLLALLSGSVLSGVLAFLFSTVVITICGEILPQSYFSRHALRVAGLLTPLIRAYQLLLWPVARPTAWVLDRWLGREAITFYRERDLSELIRLHMDASGTEISRVEGLGAMNFLSLDDIPLAREGEPLHPDSIVELDWEAGGPVFPQLDHTRHDPFLRRLQRPGTRRVVLVDRAREPRLVLDTDAFIRAALFDPEGFVPLDHCHRPVVVRDPEQHLGDVIHRFRVRPRHREDDVLDDDVILLWSESPRIITGSDIIGRLLRGIVLSAPPVATTDNQPDPPTGAAGNRERVPGSSATPPPRRHRAKD